MAINYYQVLTECGIDVDWAAFNSLNEANQLKVTDDALTGMLRFITTKYNSIDFKEIEKSAGDIAKFRYTGMLKENVTTLRNIYDASPDNGAQNYIKVCNDIELVMNFLDNRRREISDLYKSGNGIIQMMYTSLVAGCIFAVGILVANTIRFVTTETETDCQVLFDEIPGTIKNIHIKNITVAADNIGDFGKIVDHYAKPSNTRAMQEAVSVNAVLASIGKGAGYAKATASVLTASAQAAIAAHPVMVGIIGVSAILMLLPKLIVLIREIIYSIYFMRVKVSDMLAVQADLLNTNIESLEGTGRGTKKVIARQRKIADKLTKWQNAIAVKIDSTSAAVNSQKRSENAKLKLDSNSPLIKDPGALSAGDLML